MYFDPFHENMFGEPLWAWVAVAVITVAVIWLFHPPDFLTKEGRAARRRAAKGRRGEGWDDDRKRPPS